MTTLGLAGEGATLRRRLFGLGIAALGLAGAIVATPQQDEISEEIESARSAQEQWVSLRTQISKEKATLAEKKLAMQDRIDLAQSQIETTRALVEERRASVAETTKKRDELEQENAKLKDASASLEGKIDAFEARVLELVKRLPDPLIEQVRPYTQQFPKPGVETKLSLSQRYTLAVAVLNAIDKYNTQVHIVSERRTLSDGQSAEVTAMYLGIGMGFFVNGLETFAGRGVPSDEGFQWTPINEAAPIVASAVRIEAQKDPAAYTQLPVVIESAASAPAAGAGDGSGDEAATGESNSDEDGE